jgi:hypothetical protein
MYCCHAQPELPLSQSGESNEFVLSWSENWFAPACESVSPFAPVTLSNNPVADNMDPDDTRAE